MKSRRASLLLRFLFVASLLVPGAIHAAPDAPPLPKRQPTEEEILLRLKSAKSPQNQSEFFDLVQTAVVEKKVNWLLAAATNPDRTLRMHALHRSAALPKAEAGQLWGSLLLDTQWDQVTTELDRDDKRTLQIMVEDQVAKVTGRRPKGDFSRQSFRGQIRPQLQQAPPSR